MNIPLFSYVTIQNPGSFDLEWETYVCEHFLIPQNKFHYAAVNKALEYNLSNIDHVLNKEEVSQWSELIGSYNLKYYMGITGKYLRVLYELSDKTVQIACIIGMHLDQCTDSQEKIDFLSLIPNDYSIFENFYINEEEYVLNIFLDTFIDIKEDIKNKQFNYLAQHIYTPNFIENVKITNAYFMLKTDHLLREWKLSQAHTFVSQKQQLDFIVSVIYEMECSLQLKNTQSLYKSTALDIQKQILALFEEKYPEQYKQYTTLRNIGLDLTPTELSAQLATCESIDTLTLPGYI